MLVLSEDDLIGLLPPLQIVATVEAALRAQEAGQVIAPKRLHVQWENNTLLTMPAAAYAAAAESQLRSAGEPGPSGVVV